MYAKQISAIHNVSNTTFSMNEAFSSFLRSRGPMAQVWKNYMTLAFNNKCTKRYLQGLEGPQWLKEKLQVYNYINKKRKTKHHVLSSYSVQCFHCYNAISSDHLKRIQLIC